MPVPWGYCVIPTIRRILSVVVAVVVGAVSIISAVVPVRVAIAAAVAGSVAAAVGHRDVSVETGERTNDQG